MSTTHRRPVRIAVATGCATLLAIGTGALTADAGRSQERVVSSGPLADFATTVAGPFDGAWATATLEPRWRGSKITLDVWGIDRSARGMTYGAHLHNGPCVTDAKATAGAHYNTDVEAGKTYAEADKSPRTEVWLDFDVDRRGRAESSARVPFVPSAGARSIVIHAMETNETDGTAGDRLACLPLVWAPFPAS